MSDDQFNKLLAWSNAQMNKWFDEISNWDDEPDIISAYTEKFMRNLKDLIAVFKNK